MHIGTPYTKEEILAGLDAESQKVHTFFSALPEDQFFTAPDGVWSPAENLIHLVQSSKPIVLMLSLPRTALRLRFGKAPHESRTLQQVRTQYTDVALAGGGEASGEFLPIVRKGDSAERTKILSNWLKTSKSVTEKLASWKESDLDKHCAPHPLLGKMTVRELLFFTLYHNMHHVRDVQTLLGQPLDEWFDLS